MFRFFFLWVTVMLMAINLLSQNPSPGPAGNGKGSISGILIDSVTASPIEFASAGLFRSRDQRLVTGTITNEKGLFQFNDILPGDYYIQIDFWTYTSRKLDHLHLAEDQLVLDLGSVRLSPSAQLLEEIRIVGEAALIEARPDKIVYNAEKDITSRGGDASDVLRKVPLLAVDLDGNVSLRGSENIRILINGKTSGLFKGSIADALKLLPADQIQSVEVITAPSAKYDGEGTAGIINIITRKKNIEGLTGSIDLTVGTRSERGNFNMNYGRGKFALSFSSGGHYGVPQEGLSTFLREDVSSSGQNLLEQNGTNTSSRLGLRNSLGLEYKIDSTNTLSSSLSFRPHRSKNDQLVDATYHENTLLTEAYTRSTDRLSYRQGWDWDLGYRKSFRKKDQEFSLDMNLDFDRDKTDAEYVQSHTIPLDLASTLQQNMDRGHDRDFSLQSDYAHPLTDKIKLETGAKVSLSRISSDFGFETYDPDNDFWIPDPEQTDVFTYDQNVYAGYVSGTFAVDKRTTLIAGVRGEWTTLAGDFEIASQPFDNAYMNVLPSVTLSRKIGDYNQVKLSYVQRIQRPDQREINPYIEYNDNRDISYGNPYLLPETTHQVELGTNIFLKGNMVSLSLFGRQTEDVIENLLSINDDGVSETTYQNFGTKSQLGLNAFGSVGLGKLTVRGSFDFSGWKSKGIYEGQTLKSSGVDYHVRLNANMELGKDLRAEAFIYYRSPSYTVQGKNPNWSMMSFAIKKDFFNKRLSVGINITEPFRENLNFIREISGTDFYQYSKNSRPVRSFGLTLGYRFGKLDFNDRSGRKRNNNQDFREEDQPTFTPYQGG